MGSDTVVTTHIILKLWFNDGRNVLFCTCVRYGDNLFWIVGKSCHPLSVFSAGVVSAISIASPSLVGVICIPLLYYC